MKIVIKNKSDVPIYEQIEEQIKSQILEGKAEEDEQLPSIRQLARDLKIIYPFESRSFPCSFEVFSFADYRVASSRADVKYI